MYLYTQRWWHISESSPVCPHSVSLQTLSLYFLFDMSYNSSHLRTNSVNFLIHFWRQKTGSTRCKQTLRSVMEETWDCSHYRKSSRYRPVRTRSVTSSIVARQRRRNGTETWRNGTETWRRRSCLWEHLRLITHEKNFTERWRRDV